MREWLSRRSMPWHLPWAAGFAVVMGVIGPFGSYLTMSLPVRLLYFLLLVVTFWSAIASAIRVSARWEATRRWPLPARLAAAGLFSALPGTVAVFAVHGALVQPIPIRFAPQIFAESAFLAVALSLVIGLFADWRLHAAADRERARVAAAAPGPQAAATPAPAAAAPAPDFFRRIPPALGRDLLALEMEDHYLRIHTAVGSDLILLRLRDALAELGPDRGRQVHRSWWVADGAVAGAERAAGGRILLALRNGLQVPVSKSFRETVKQAGWLG